ncbi:uncharacterized protein K444DRAFT_660287 [Hyaloscypha bicolor E]|uniref:Uncharacterized protein n=1 Tax=Hyaloscypha bicolor E TaxID=1095630 RepID=A0A2J6TQ56_9HELO|nr:uncharacterized protein K444DRAFT_660287 [Hyaloscypha bicolor E]PMD65157.1 hypothetical protein K444DRAFT_660287 [Hyaloscypha bicolor E]
MRGALWFSWGLHWRCIMRFTYSSGHVVLFGRATLAGLGVGAKPGRPAVGSECSSRFGCHAHAVQDGRSFADGLQPAGAFAPSLPACQPASLQACQQLPARFWNTKLAELNSKARLHRARLGVGHNAPASMLALSPFSCSDNRESSVLPVTQSNSIWQCAILGLATRPDSRGGPPRHKEHKEHKLTQDIVINQLTAFISAQTMSLSTSSLMSSAVSEDPALRVTNLLRTRGKG